MARLTLSFVWKLFLEEVGPFACSVAMPSCKFVMTVISKINSIIQGTSIVAQTGRTITGAAFASATVQYRIRNNVGYEDVKTFQILNLSYILGLVYIAFIATFAWAGTQFLLKFMSHMLYLMEQNLFHNFVIDIFLGYSCGYFANFVWIQILKSGTTFGATTLPENHFIDTSNLQLSQVLMIIAVIVIGLLNWLMPCYSPTNKVIDDKCCQAVKTSHVKTS